MKSIFKRFLCIAAVAVSFAFVGNVASAKWCSGVVIIDDNPWYSLATTSLAMGKHLLICDQTQPTNTFEVHVLRCESIKDSFGKDKLVVHFDYDDVAPGCLNCLKSTKGSCDVKIFTKECPIQTWNGLLAIGVPLTQEQQEDVVLVCEQSTDDEVVACLANTLTPEDKMAVGTSLKQHLADLEAVFSVEQSVDDDADERLAQTLTRDGAKKMMDEVGSVTEETNVSVIDLRQRMQEIENTQRRLQIVGLLPKSNVPARVPGQPIDLEKMKQQLERTRRRLQIFGILPGSDVPAQVPNQSMDLEQLRRQHRFFYNVFGLPPGEFGKK